MVEYDSFLLGEDDIDPCFPLRTFREARGYYIFHKYLSYVPPLGRSRVTPIKEASQNGVPW